MATLGIPALFAAGLLTFLSPCVLPLVPIYLAMLAGTSALALRQGGHGRRLVLSTVAFALGIGVVFVLLGMAASTLGRVLSTQRLLFAQLGGLAVFLAGLKLMGFLRVPWLEREARPWLASVGRGTGVLWPFLFGAAFAVGWSPCVGPVLGSVLVLAAGSGSALTGAGYLAVYALGLTLPLVAISLFAPLALRWLDRAKRHLRTFEVASGTLLAAVGLLFITGHQAWLMQPFSDSPPAASTAAAPAPDAPVTCSAGTGEPGTATAPAAPMAAVASVADAPTMLEFVSPSCPICQRMAPVVASAERDCSRHGVRFERIDVATAAGRARAASYGVLGVPTFVFLDGSGGEVARLVGQQPRELLIQSMEVLAGRSCEGFHPLPEPAPGS